jgi:flagellin
MALRIMTNESAINAQRHLGISSDRLSNDLEKLNSGSRINHASDDAAGLAISDTQNATIRSMGQAMKNAQDAVSLVQVFEGGTNEINNSLIRIRELSMQSASDTVGDRERLLINNEVQELKSEIDRIAGSTKYAGKVLLTGETPVLEFQIGPDNNPDVDRITFDPGNSNLTAGALNVDGLDVSKKQDAQDSLELLDDAIFRVNQVRSKIGSVQGRLMSAYNTDGIFSENLSAARSRIRDTDVALESSNLARDTIIRNSGVAMLSQANQTPAVALQLLRQ